MNGESFVPYLNFISRWVLFVAVFYKAYRTREKGWAILTTAFFIDALDVESYILEPLGIILHPDAYAIASKIPNFIIAFLLMWGAVHLKYGESRLKHVVYISLFSVISYIWLLLLATDVFNNPTTRAILPSLAFGGGLIYVGNVLRKYVVSHHWVEMMFPWGLILLGALNLTYPVTRFIEWFAPIGFFMGAVFRLMTATGATKFVFYPLTPVMPPTDVKIPPGAYLFPTREEVVHRFGNVWDKPGVILITREDVGMLKENIHPNTLVFWITRAKEGKLEESPTIYAMGPTKIDILTDLITRAIGQGYGLIYIDALEYLMLENGFENAVKFLLNVKDRVVSAGGTIILVANLRTLEPRQRRILEREFSH
ncbi:hypothetical protein APY94_08435 [Thermococcus celericrescens]|uniref:DUF835 domain-containing protein n=1 Tax=Thermococcus celericrescens TaxID=227598 RepID=A0A100XX28_9EURY|nr:DUF835 domain-containing protein [Thermococcus celericrescens]KUH32802.1 hypothetical protein APY94_08435 [Thermococcus celericrescens]